MTGGSTPQPPVAERPRAPDARRQGRPYHYRSQYAVIASRTPGKPGHFDVVLVRKNAAGIGFKETVHIVRAWRSCRGDGKPGTPHDLALKAAHDLRTQLDSYVHYLQQRVTP